MSICQHGLGPKPIQFFERFFSKSTILFSTYKLQGILFATLRKTFAYFAHYNLHSRIFSPYRILPCCNIHMIYRGTKVHNSLSFLNRKYGLYTLLLGLPINPIGNTFDILCIYAVFNHGTPCSTSGELTSCQECNFLMHFFL